jgi:hypothetical protein
MKKLINALPTDYAVRSVRVYDISELSLVPSIPMQSSNHDHDFFCVGVMYSGEYDVCVVTLSVYSHRASPTNMPDHSRNRTYDPRQFRINTYVLC